MVYNGKYKGSEIDALLGKAGSALQSVPSEYITEEELNKKGYATTSAMNTALGEKQDAISDLDAIRSGAAKGATALQEHQDISNLATKSEVNAKVDKVTGKQLSTEDFTTALKNKLNGLSNYDDTALNNAISGLQTQIDTLVSGDANTAIESFNEIIAFLDGVSDTETLEGIIASIEQQIAAKQDVISDLATIRAGAAKGATALQSYTEQYKGTVTGIKMNGASKGTSGVVDLGTVITDVSSKQDKGLKFTNLTASSWVDDTTYENYPYRCDLVCSGVTADMYAEVVFDIEQATSGNYAPVCETKANIVSIWSKVNDSITISTIIITK